MCDLKLLCTERISRARNEHSGEFLKNYSRFRADQISHRRTANFALIADHPGAHTLFPDCGPPSHTVRDTRPTVLFPAAVRCPARALTSAQPRMGEEPRATHRAGLLLHRLLIGAAELAYVTMVAGLLFTSRGGPILGSTEDSGPVAGRRPTGFGAAPGAGRWRCGWLLNERSFDNGVAGAAGRDVGGGRCDSRRLLVERRRWGRAASAGAGGGRQNSLLWRERSELCRPSERETS